MSGHRPVVLTLTAFATAMGALGVAALTAWQRCGRGSDCSPELALGIVAVAPACLIGILMLAILHTKLRMSWIRRIVLAAGVGVAALPLAAFLLRDVWLVPALCFLVAAAALLALEGERGAADAISHHGRQPSSRISKKSSDTDFEEVPGVLTNRTEKVLVLLDEVAALNREIVRLGQFLARHG